MTGTIVCVWGAGEMRRERKQGIQIINHFRGLGVFLWDGKTLDSSSVRVTQPCL